MPTLHFHILLVVVLNFLSNYPSLILKRSRLRTPKFHSSEAAFIYLCTSVLHFKRLVFWREYFFSNLFICIFLFLFCNQLSWIALINCSRSVVLASLSANLEPSNFYFTLFQIILEIIVLSCCWADSLIFLAIPISSFASVFWTIQLIWQ